jgi:alkylated DNA repair dioxygenase AlkB
VFDVDYATLVAEAHPVDAGRARWQASLFGAGDPRADPAIPTRTRHRLDDRSWIDLAPAWLHGADDVFDALHQGVRWRCPEVTMYERRLHQPRLSSVFRLDGAPEGTTDDGVPGDDPRRLAPVLELLRTSLGSVYSVEFDSIGLNLYRDGSDSVAWHGDRHARVQVDPIVAIVALGSPRPFLVRPKAGGTSTRFILHPGDLLVMGGACQHEWEHAVPKVRSAGPRLSVTYRHSA